MTPHFDKRSNTGLRHFLNAARFSIDGIKSALNQESAFRQECAACIVLFPLAFVIAEHFITAVALISICLIVLAVELLNSGIEAAIDRSGLEFHPLAKQAKDFGSAAVFITLIATGLIWLAVLVDFFMRSTG